MSQELETKTCPECGRPSLPDREACWQCGADLSQVGSQAVPLGALPALPARPPASEGGPEQPRRSSRLAVAAAAVVFLLLMGWIAVTLAGARNAAGAGPEVKPALTTGDHGRRRAGQRAVGRTTRASVTTAER